MAVIERQAVQYQVQDLRCTKCGLVPADNMGDLCSTCSGALKTSMSLHELQKRCNRSC